MIKLIEDGYVYISPKTNRVYHLLEGTSLGGTTTSDIVFIFDYQNDIDVDNEGKIVGWFYGATFHDWWQDYEIADGTEDNLLAYIGG